MADGAARALLRPPGSLAGRAAPAPTDDAGAGGGDAGAPRPAGGAGRPGRVARRHRSPQRVVRRERAHAAPPRARRRRCQPAGDGGGGTARRHRERPPAHAPGVRAGVARDAAPSVPPDLASRRPALRAARVLGGRARRARAEGGDHDAHGPRLSPLRQARGGRGVTTWAADVIVVGAGPAGAATAILLAEHGVAVQLLDRARFPRPKICGEYLSPEAPRVLDRLGVLKTVDGLATPLAGMRITAPDGTVVIGTYRTVGDWRPYREHATAIERARLDEALVERVRALPIDFREHVRVIDVLVERGEVRGVVAVDRDGRAARLRARLVIAAYGRASVVAERLGLRHGHRLRRMALVTYVSGLDGCRDYGEVFVDPPDYAIINPVAADRGNLSIVVPLAHAAPWSGRLETFFTARAKHLQHLARRLAGARIVAPVGAMGPLAYEVDAPRVGGVLLVGDAAGFVDPFTGEGIYAALHGAELAVETAVGALRSGDCSRQALVAYRRARRLAFGGKARVTRALQFVISHRGLANLTAHVLAQRPGLLDVLLGVIGDFVPPKALVTGLVR